MIDICVIYASKNKQVVEKLVLLLRKDWEVWWDGDLHQGDWDKVVKNKIKNTKAVVAVFSSDTEDSDIFKDELYFAKKQNKLIYPFFLEEADPPLGFGVLHRTDAFQWDGDGSHPGFMQLRQKIMADIQHKTLERKFALEIKGKKLKLPGFMFSLSSYETQISPNDGVTLFKLLKPAAGLISAYDVWKYVNGDNHEKDKERFLENIKELQESPSALILDSGNYEAYRKKDQFSKDNEKGWCKEKFREIAAMVSPDIVFSFDEPKPQGEIGQIADRVIDNFYQDKKAIGIHDINLCPIIHLPEVNENVADQASRLAIKVASELKPLILAIPERELGDGIIERVKTVRQIRQALNSLGEYYPLHLLGTGNPITMIALAAAGADSFDGLEWCRTVADYDNGHLFHFQHFDFFKEPYLPRLQSPLIRALIEKPEVPYATQVIVYNLDFFNEWTKTIQDMIAAGQVEYLLKNIPNIGNKIFKELKSDENKD